MVFSSLIFLFRFLPAVLLCYYIVCIIPEHARSSLPFDLRNLILFLFSIIFYAWGEPVYIVLMVVSILITYTGGIMIDRMKKTGRKKKAKAVLIAGCAVSLFLLGFFKYADFITETVNSLTSAGFKMLNLALPIGISFYTFQSMSYMIDVYRGEADVQRNLISYGAYVVMFPQLIAGPIVQYKTIDRQLCGRKETPEEFAEGIHRFMIGLGKKVLLANNAGALWDSINTMTLTDVPVLTAWLGIAAYTFQIYFDFSGYSDMAIGLGHMFGFHFAENFNYPYISKSITEFWRRWHISLSSWFRDYVYIPLGGNRVSVGRHIMNLMIVWLLTGIWHGASWNFVLWGLYYGVILVTEKYVIGKYLAKTPAAVQHIYSMFLVMMGWVLFSFTDLTEGMHFIRALFGGYGAGLLNSETIYLFYNNVILLAVMFLASTQIPKKIGKSFENRFKNSNVIIIVARGLFYTGIFLLSLAWLVDASYNPFLYFRF